ncbi:MAG: ArnT family glycosyltransferase, partial [Gemmataceae bacterium]
MPARMRDYLILAVVLAAVTLPNLGTPALWDVDEGVNAGCTREMMESGSWIVPTFNSELRTAKPVMLYWLQRASFNALGISEFSARLPAVLLSFGTILCIYELARRMYDAATARLAGIILATTIEFCKLAHAATPDAPLIFFSTLLFTLYWCFGEGRARNWFLPTAVASALAVLTKGPVGLALPGAVLALYFLWNRELLRLLDRRLLGGIALWLLIAVPWYAFVISETRGAYLAFFQNENANRFLNSMEGHRGPIIYYIGAIIAFSAPWSAFLGGTLWNAFQQCRTHWNPTPRPERFLLCWISVYLLFFSIAATKLPNYIAPLYPALALLTARFLRQWATRAITLPRWLMPTGLGAVALTGLVVSLGLLVAGGQLPLPIKGLRIMPELAPWAAVGLLLILTASIGAYFIRQQQREQALATLAGGTIAFIAILAGFVPAIVDE